MNKKNKSIIILFFVTIALSLYVSCNQLGLTKEKSDNTTLAVAAVLATRSTTTAPSALTYTGSPYTVTTGSAITTRTPSVTGTVSSCTSSPTMPTGLSISATTCAISGTPTVTQAATTYTITASNSVGSTTASISITISTGSTCTSGTSAGTTALANTATLNTGTDCVANVSTCMDGALPAWIKDNFKCAIGYVSGTNYAFKSQNVPNTKSYYYTAYVGQTPNTTYPLYEGLPSGNSKAGTNVIASQNFVYSIPATASKGTGTDSTQGGLVSIGITTNGIAIFNNAAAPPDTLAVEALTFDNYMGHPNNTSTYHYHAGVPKVCDNTTSTSNSGACANSALIGVILDGYALYGQKCDNGTANTSDDFIPTLDSLHGHTAVTQHFPTATYHYHYANDTTATIYTLMGSYFYGNKGSVSN